MDQSVKRMLKLIEEDGDSFAKKAQMYYQKRPQLISHVEEFYRIYRSLAERYDNVTGELRKNVPSDLQSQGSGVSDGSGSGGPIGSEPEPEPPLMSNSRARTGTRAAGFELGTKEGDEMFTLDSESESDDSSVNNYSSVSTNSDGSGLRKRIVELENELQKFHMQREELRVENEKLKTELRKYGPVVREPGYVEEEKSRVLEVDLRVMRERVSDLEEEVKRLRCELENSGSSSRNLQEKLKENASWKLKLEKEKQEVLKLQDRITRYKTNLSVRDREIRAMRETLSNANKALSEENTQLQEEVTKLLKERVLLYDTIKEWDLRCQSSDEELRRTKIAKTELEGEIDSLKFEKTELAVRVNELDGELTLKTDEINGLSQHLDQLHLEHVELVDRVEKSNKSIDELTSRSEALEKKISMQQEVIEEQAEEKREVIRQLCFSLDHYRDGYQTMRQAFIGHNKRRTVLAS